ncbi:MAG: MBL fold metallo-hydrolase [Flavobacteriales bacterium]|nr:MBL fold metallo-hydrolase [Flavobacteriales bacterium]MCX7768435.1 MBL fold metallo-hydrolase [Flavobacteriales bacterium]MDW8409672.1 MBL fold metallo-hydrolase [Flavobacteriales bacterium]
MKLYTIDTGFFKLDGGAMFGVVPKSIWNKLNPADENNMCTWAMRCLLVENAGHLTLIDCGIGNKQDEKFFSYYYLHGEDSLEKSLHRYGFTAEDVTDVILTHLHFDHCGGAVKRSSDGRLEPTFPRARYWSNRAHWQWASNPNLREKASFLKENFAPLKEWGQIYWCEDGQEVTPGVSVKFFYGHTEAQMIPYIQIGTKTLVYCADLIPSSAHIKPAYIMAYDVRPLVSLEEREDFVEKAVANKYILFFEHDPRYACGILTQKDDRLEGKFFVHLEEVL